MKNKGFTLVELLAIILIIGVIAAISFSSISGINKSTKEKMLENKLELIENAAILYVNKNDKNITKTSIKNSDKKFHPGDRNLYSCTSIQVKDLLDAGLIETDSPSDCSDTGTSTTTCVINPADNNLLDDVDVILYYKNSRIYAKADINNKCVGEDNECGNYYSNCYLYGDVNDDNSVNSVDGLLFERACLSNLIDGSYCQLTRHDLNLDNVVNCYDVCLMIAKGVGVINALPYTDPVPACISFENVASCYEGISLSNGE